MSDVNRILKLYFILSEKKKRNYYYIIIAYCFALGKNLFSMQSRMICLRQSQLTNHFYIPSLLWRKAQCLIIPCRENDLNLYINFSVFMIYDTL